MKAETIAMDGLADQAEQDYRQLVRKVVEGGRVTRPEVHQILVLANRSATDLQSHVGRLQRRLQAEKDVASAEQMEPDREAATTARQGAQEERAALVKRHEAELKAATDRINELQRAECKIIAAQSKLRNSGESVARETINPELVAESAALANDLRTAQYAASQAEGAVERQQEAVSKQREQVKSASEHFPPRPEEVEYEKSALKSTMEMLTALELAAKRAMETVKRVAVDVAEQQAELERRKDDPFEGMRWT